MMIVANLLLAILFSAVVIVFAWLAANTIIWIIAGAAILLIFAVWIINALAS